MLESAGSGLLFNRPLMLLRYPICAINGCNSTRRPYFGAIHDLTLDSADRSR
jgi:hypothetical protein